MIKSESAKQTIKNITSELFSLNPSTLISLFIIDVTDLGINQGIFNENENDKTIKTVFRFHNNVNLTNSSIFWRGEEYTAAPITIDGIETSIRGSPPNPRLSMTVSEEGIPYLNLLKEKILEMGDIIGGKFTRIRTFSKYLDAQNFLQGIPPKNFFPDPNAEIGRDIFYIDRKSSENKTFIEYELSTLFDLEGVKLPARLVSSNTCQWQYRGCGCLYEYSARKNEDIHEDGELPDSAPPVATSFDEPINQLITGVPFVDKGQYNKNEIYNKGDCIFMNHRGLNYYFVSKVDNNGTQPPNSAYWIFDDCGRKMLSCKLRWQNVNSGLLPFGGFISVNRFR